MTITELVDEAHKIAVEHGWWDKENSFGELIANCHSELSEALEEARKGHKPTKVYYNASLGMKPEGIPIELADCVMRIADMCGYYGIDLEAAIQEKMKYNAHRPYRHGKMF